MHWTEPYIGIPWLAGGRDLETGLDCWGLLRFFYAKEYGIDLSVNANAVLDRPDLMERLFVDETTGGQWHEVDVAQDGDAIGVGKGSALSHVGIYCMADGRPSMLHAHVGALSSIWSLRNMQRSGWSHIKFYRHDLRL